MARYYFQGFDGKWYVADDHTTSMLEVLQRRMDEAYKRIMDKESRMTTIEKIRAEIEQKIEQERFARSVFRGEEKDAVKAEQCTGSIMAYNNVIKLIDKYAEQQEPTVSIETYQQVCKERDIAIEQLHELGYELGQKIEPCNDVVSRQAVLEGLRTCYDTETKEYLDGSQWINYEDAIAEMENLPSVHLPPKPGDMFYCGMAESEDKG